MRRRSERKKSASPAPLPARRSRRSRKVSDNEKTEDETIIQKTDETNEPLQSTASVEEINEERASSEERAASPVRKSRSTRTTPKKRRGSGSGEKNNETKVDTIPEEVENGTDAEEVSSRKSLDATDTLPGAKNDKNNAEETQNVTVPTGQSKPCADEEDKQDDAEDVDGRRVKKTVEEYMEEVKIPSPSISLTANKDEEHLKTSVDVLDIQTEDVEEKDDATAPVANLDDGDIQKEDRKGGREKKRHRELKHDEPTVIKEAQSNRSDELKENRKESKTQDKVDVTPQHHDATAGEASDKHGTMALQTQRSARKRKWLTKKITERVAPVLAISTDSLKNIIADVVQPVPLSDVQLESSSEEEGLVNDSEHESDERSLTPEILKVTAQLDAVKTMPSTKSRKDRDDVVGTNAEEHQKGKRLRSVTPTANNGSNKVAVAPAVNVARSPSPPRNRSSHVLYITNLVRPFTVLQLKGLLARTGKIVDDNGFWIDRIKSKCFVAYTTEDEAIETRHALHGVRWPVSNPKCLNVDFGSRTDMDRAIKSTKEEGPRYSQDNTRDNQQASNAWSRLDASEKKPARPVREWDVGKKEPNDREKQTNDRRRGSMERVDARGRDMDRGSTNREHGAKDRKRSRERERERSGREHAEHGHRRSRSGSPAPKLKKKENEPPIRLLDDLFRKTKATPCIYWLPLTPEAIAEKEAFRQKRIEEHKQRIKEREQERQKERERQRDTRRNRSIERRRSRSRDRRRY